MNMVYKMVYEDADDFEFHQEIIDAMENFWNKFTIDIWERDKNLHILNGKVCAKFTKNLPRLIKIFEEHKDMDSPNWENLCLLLKTWPKLTDITASITKSKK